MGIPVHRGFLNSAQQVYAQVRPLLDQEYEVRLTGHSLGGAVAAILLMMLKEDGFTLGQSVTFGQPKVTNEDGVEKYHDLPLLRVVNLEDPVPLLPPPTLLSSLNGPYRHFGAEVWLLGGSEFKYFAEDGPERLDGTSLWDHLGDEKLEDHSIRNYITGIERVIDGSFSGIGDTDGAASSSGTP